MSRAATISNPFATYEDALENSSYGRYEDGRLLIGEAPAPLMAEDIHAALRALLHDPDFPCLGAKSIVKQGSYRFGLYHGIGEPGSTAGLAYDLSRFVVERPHLEGDFSTYIASFLEPKVKTPKEFEGLLWRQLSALHELDKPHNDWTADVSANPEDPQFAFSFAGHAFFVVGLSPGSRRWARRFPWPTLIFNDHAQFDRLRVEQHFERLRDLIRERDERLHGSANDMLEDFGTHSEARQYAGRRVSENWRCPVHFD